ncbi:MAG: YdcH family protein [Stellaceae bacterium]
MDFDIETMKAKIAELKIEHHDLDAAIAALERSRAGLNRIQLQRLKKRKLALKDLIARLESQLLPDIIA